MSKVRIYDTPEEMWKQVGQAVYDTNLRTRETLDDLYKKAMLEYKEKSGFNKWFIEAQEKRNKEKSWASTFSPDMVHLPEDEQEKFNEQYRDLGKNLELTALIQLYVFGNEYGFCEESGYLGVTYEGNEEYKDIGPLANTVKGTLQQLKRSFFGAKLTPLFYTTKENEPIVPEQISNNPEGYIQEITREMEEKESLPKEFKDLFVEGFRDFINCKDKIRGLTEEECAEFERLYSNTP